MTEEERIETIKPIQEKLQEQEIQVGTIEASERVEEKLKGNIIENLNALREFEINKNILKETKIGVTVNKLTKVNDEEISELAKELVEKWKQIAKKEKAEMIKKNEIEKKRKSEGDRSHLLGSNEIEKHKKSRKSDDTNNSSIHQKECCNHNNSEEEKKTSNKSSPKRKRSNEVLELNEYKDNKEKEIEEEHNVSSDDMNHYPKLNDLNAVKEWNYKGILDDDEHRDKAKNFLFKAFITGSGTSLLYVMEHEKLNELVKDIENELYQIYVLKKNSQREYNMQLKAIKFNLGDQKNPHFNEKVYYNEISPKELVVMNSQDMASEEKKNEREKCLKESLLACQSDWEVKNILLKRGRRGEFQCFKCKGYETVYNQLQTRSSDEPMTTFVTCLKCQNRWKM